MTKKVILQVLPSLHSGGVERGTIDIARALIENGDTSMVISSGGPLVAELERYGSTHIRLPVHSKNPLQLLINYVSLVNIIRKHKVDLIHVRSRAPAWSVLCASDRTKIPMVTTFHGAYGHQNRLKRLYNSAMLRGSITIAVSDFIETHIQRTYPEFSDHIKVIHRGIDTKVFNSKNTDQDILTLKNRYNIPIDKRVILLPARLTRIKGHLLLLDAIRRIDHSALHVLMVGDEPGKESYRNEILAFARKHGLSQHLQMLGNQDDMTSIYGVTDIVVSATLKPESFGRVACEAQAMGKPVIASAHGGSNETIAPHIQDLMFQANNPSALALALEKAIVRLQKNNIDQNLLKKHITENFALEKMCQQTLNTYDQLLNSAPQTRPLSSNISNE